MNGYRAKLLQGKLLKGTSGSSGYDMFAIEDVVIYPNESKAISTGVFIEITEGYEGQVRGRSGLNFKHDIFCPTGTIDSDYTGDIGIILINHGKQAFIIQNGDRIAQLVFQKVEQAEFELVDSLEETQRGEGGFGSTGVKENSENTITTKSDNSLVDNFISVRNKINTDYINLRKILFEKKNRGISLTNEEVIALDHFAFICEWLYDYQQKLNELRENS